MHGAIQLLKSDIINILVERHGLKRYLEVVTPRTGFQFPKINASPLEVCDRIVYRCPFDFNDGSVVTYQVEDDGIGAALETIKKTVSGYDIIFVDPHHTYESSWQSIVSAFEILAPQGFVVIHDCNPPTMEIAGPEFKPGEWCGVTYLAYLDFVLADARRSYLTVDTDYGVGVIRKKPRRLFSTDWPFIKPTHGWETRAQAYKAELWQQRQASNNEVLYDFFSRDRLYYLNLISPLEFEHNVLLPL